MVKAESPKIVSVLQHADSKTGLVEKETQARGSWAWVTQIPKFLILERQTSEVFTKGRWGI